jgi:hypothetical protein
MVEATLFTSASLIVGSSTVSTLPQLVAYESYHVCHGASTNCNGRSSYGA